MYDTLWRLLYNHFLPGNNYIQWIFHTILGCLRKLFEALLIFPDIEKILTSTVNKCQAMVNFDYPYLSCNDHCDWWLFQEIFFIIISKKLFWMILNLFS